MKHALFTFTLLVVLISCSGNEQEKSKQEEEPTQKTNTQQTSPNGEIVKIFRSTDTGTNEYLRLQITKDRSRSWFYWSDKSEKEVQLGSKDVDGIEGIFFHTNKNEVYEVASSECGFSLFLGDKRIQWYEQTEPECSTYY